MAAGAHVVPVPGHTHGSIALHLPGHGVLSTGDTVAASPVDGTVIPVCPPSTGVRSSPPARGWRSRTRTWPASVTGTRYGRRRPVRCGRRPPVNRVQPSGTPASR
ncbi:MBL fold metallo-hydrolase [Streptomyces sp. NPDC058735]|uniref:MBL fold metallo-hydrolase n=1 Tax=unclassified Streptomyces TaxID=2593676 RepID=UPI0036C9F2A3